MLEREKIIEKIAAQGLGAGVKWETIAYSAMCGNEAAQTACLELAEAINDTPRTMAIYWQVASAAWLCQTDGEHAQGLAESMQALNAKHDPTNDADKYLSNRLAALRKAAGMTQLELAAKAGVSLSSLQKLENGSNSMLNALTRTTVALSSALGVTVNELVR